MRLIPLIQEFCVLRYSWHTDYSLTQKLQIPGHGNFQTLDDRVGRGIAKHPLRLGDICLRMAHIARAKIPVDRLAFIRHALLRKPSGQMGKQFILCRACVHGNVEHLAGTVRHIECCENVGLHRVINKAKIPARLAIAVDENIIAADH